LRWVQLELPGKMRGRQGHLHRAGHGTYTRQKSHGVSLRSHREAVSPAGSRHVHAGTVVGKLEGEPAMIMGDYKTLRQGYVEKDLQQGLYSDHDWASLPGVMPVASGQMHQLLPYLGEDSILQFAGGTIGHRWASRPAPAPTASPSKRSSGPATRVAYHG
jgi:ribulose-bisphosphate carboxylase large chain